MLNGRLTEILNNIESVIEFKVLSIGGFNITLVDVSAFFSITVTYLFLNRLLGRIFKRDFFTRKLGDEISGSLRRFVKLNLALVFLSLAFEVLGADFLGVLKKNIFQAGKISFSLFHFLVLVFIILATRITIYLLQAFITRKTGSIGIDPGRENSLFQIIKYIVYVIAFVVFIESLGFSITIFIASFSALLVGLGLGIQNLFNDFISGLILLFDGSLKINDVVEIEGGIVGRVVSIGFRTTEIITRDDVNMIVPNSIFTGEKIINWTHNSKLTRFSVEIGVEYGSDVQKVRELLLQCAMNMEGLSEVNAPDVMFTDFGESSLNFKLFFWTENTFRVEKIKSDIRFQIDRLFRENGIVIPFKQVDIHIKE